MKSHTRIQVVYQSLYQSGPGMQYDCMSDISGFVSLAKDVMLFVCFELYLSNYYFKDNLRSEKVT